ncbi:hypothetical protein AB0942_09370 [Streptomyces nodosus]|uniref:hypothetical protein n=1 Tax=Streptomyces nodosus TaxID=40318 RepID=UPI0034536AA2
MTSTDTSGPSGTTTSGRGAASDGGAGEESSASRVFVLITGERGSTLVRASDIRRVSWQGSRLLHFALDEEDVRSHLLPGRGLPGLNAPSITDDVGNALVSGFLTAVGEAGRLPGTHQLTVAGTPPVWVRETHEP